METQIPRGCFLVGCGPSLNRIDVRRLASHDTITFNRAYIGWERWGFDPTYYACFDPIGLADIAGDIRELISRSGVRRFFLHDSAVRYGIKATGRVTLVTLSEDVLFSADFHSMADFGNVGASSLQILAALGYRRVAMVGVDARYSTTEDFLEDAEGFVPLGEDTDHFDPNYLRRRRPVDSDFLRKVLGRWPQVAKACHSRGLEVRNCSPGSALSEFESIEFEEALAWTGVGAHSVSEAGSI